MVLGKVEEIARNMSDDSAAHACIFDDHYHVLYQLSLSLSLSLSLLDDLRKKLNIFKDMNPTDEILKSAINAAISKELKRSTDVGLITNELAKLQQEELISPELLAWATTETQREHGHMLEANTPTGDPMVMMCSPVELNHDDLYHASLCSTVVNTSNATEQCKRLIQSLSYKSVKELSLSQPNNVATFPKCMIAISSDNEGATCTTCYVAFENIIDYKVWKLFDDGQKASFGKGIVLLSYKEKLR